MFGKCTEYMAITKSTLRHSDIIVWVKNDDSIYTTSHAMICSWVCVGKADMLGNILGTGLWLLVSTVKYSDKQCG